MKYLVYYFAIVYCILFFAVFLFVWYFTGFSDFLEIRTSVSSGGFLLVYCIYFICRDANSCQKAVLHPLFFVPASVFLLQLSRTFSVVLLILLFYPRGKYCTAKNFAFSIFALMLLAFLSALFGLDDFILNVIGKSIYEISLNDSWTEADLGINFRGYETAMAYATYMSYELVNMIFGAGFGSLVKLDIPAFLAGNEYDAIPLLHNGYLYLLIKTGVLGVVFYSLFFSKYHSLSSRSIDRENRICVVATIIGLLFSNFLVNSLFNNESAFAYIVLGYFSNPRLSKKSFGDVL